MVLGNGVKNIKAAAYNGTRTVVKLKGGCVIPVRNNSLNDSK